jgi:hypothetical protein
MLGAWEKQSASLVEVQKRGTGLEATVRKTLGWPNGRIVYDKPHGYKIQIDAAFPNTTAPKVIVSVTYTDPDTRGHSNENKLQLKIGELALLKAAYPNLGTVLAIGGSGDAWLNYVLKAFTFFYDETLFLWQEDDRKRLVEMGKKPDSVNLKHAQFWQDFHAARTQRELAPKGTPAPCGKVRYDIIDTLRAQTPIVHNPSLIENPIARLCMRRSFDLHGAEWNNYLHGNWHSIEMSRNYFNPVEAAVELTLSEGHFTFQGGIARDVEVPSVLHDLGMTETKLSEDFVLFSKKLNMPVYIQCKASGGGRDQHGKNIQNRAKEQTARGIFYTSKSPDQATLLWQEKHFHWVSVLDGDWSVTASEPLKYIHMLQLAGYDKVFCAADLLTANLHVRKEDNPLRIYLNSLDCVVDDIKA